jgi:CubicO group peptidase (beta-lactamase class C family)
MLMPALWALQHRDDLSPRQRRVEAAKWILKAPPIGPPGEQFHYSNAGYIVAGAMLEAAGGASWEELMQREVFQPLSMKTAGFGPPADIQGHVKQDEVWKPRRHDNPAVLGPAGTVHASLADWSKFAAAHLGQVEGYLGEESFRILHEPVGPDEEGSYALGWGLHPGDGGTPLLTHAGSNTMWYALIVLDREAGVACLAVCNAPSPDACGDVIDALQAQVSP